MSRQQKRSGERRKRKLQNRLTKLRQRHDVSPTYDPLEPRRVLAVGVGGNDCPPDLNLTGVESQSINVGESLTLDILQNGGTVSDVDAIGNPTGDRIRFQLDPDIPEDTPVGIEISEDGVLSWTPTAAQVGTHRIVVIAIDAGEQPLADAEVLNIEVTNGSGVNGAPTVDLNGTAAGVEGSASFIEDGGAIGIAATDLLLADADDAQLESATVQITNLFDGELETLAANTTGTAISAAYDSSNGTLSLAGTDSLANYQQVLRSVAYNNTSENPDTTDRQIEFIVNDRTVDSDVATAIVSVAAVNDAPDISPVSDQTIESGELLSITVSATDPDGDDLVFQLDRDDPNANVPADAAIVNNNDGTATITWIANTAGTFNFVVLATDDADAPLSDRETFAVTVSQANAPFEIDLGGLGDGGEFIASFAEDQGAVALVSSDATIDLPAGASLSSLTVTIANLLDGNAESLTADVTGTSISQSFDSAAGTLLLTGVDSAANYQQVLRSIQYNNTSQSPDETDRTIQYEFNDGTNSVAATSSVGVANTNDGPNLTLPAPFDDETTPFTAGLNQPIAFNAVAVDPDNCLLYTSPSPRD